MIIRSPPLDGIRERKMRLMEEKQLQQKRRGSLERLGGEITDGRYETMKSKLKIYKNSAV